MCRIYSAVYSGVPVYEMSCRGIAVMRRRADNYLNATQILKVAGVEKGRRTKILEREVHTGHHEKVQGGYGKYQGTWIPFERGIELAKKYDVLELVLPLLDSYHSGGNKDRTPTKEEARQARRRELSDQPAVITSRAKTPSPIKRSSTFYLPSSPVINPNYDIGLSSEVGTPGPLSSSVYYDVAEHPTSDSGSGIDQRDLLMSLFLSENPNHYVEQFTSPDRVTTLDLNMHLDEKRNTALHWASSLGRADIVETLLNCGADPHRVNLSGETPLMRAIYHPGNGNNNTFPKLVRLLRDTIPSVDLKGRTIFHHVALMAGDKDRAEVAKFYMSSLLNYLLQEARDTLILNKRDNNGDTAFTISAGLNDQTIMHQLLSIGANPTNNDSHPIQLSDLELDLSSTPAPVELEINDNSSEDDAATILDGSTRRGSPRFYDVALSPPRIIEGSEIGNDSPTLKAAERSKEASAAKRLALGAPVIISGSISKPSPSRISNSDQTYDSSNILDTPVPGRILKRKKDVNESDVFQKLIDLATQCKQRLEEERLRIQSEKEHEFMLKLADRDQRITELEKQNAELRKQLADMKGSEDHGRARKRPRRDQTPVTIRPKPNNNDATANSRRRSPSALSVASAASFTSAASDIGKEKRAVRDSGYAPSESTEGEMVIEASGCAPLTSHDHSLPQELTSNNHSQHNSEQAQQNGNSLQALQAHFENELVMLAERTENGDMRPALYDSLMGIPMEQLVNILPQLVQALSVPALSAHAPATPTSAPILPKTPSKSSPIKTTTKSPTKSPSRSRVKGALPTRSSPRKIRR
ncbi:uncharacterized protein VTP21DRAFT_8640 [Calcarisporiella thermophila]|uniref:uncharacterized protein n=1 Tax=Calcarisporiella thermophila TaxID=911321 RepID=UPI0037441A16